MEYKIAKNYFNIKDTKFLYVFFENGDYLSLNSSELAEYFVNLYDKLVRRRMGYCAIAESGFIKLKIKKHAVDYDRYFLHNPEEYLRNRKKYIENRCVNESRITEIWFFDKNSWHYILRGNIRATMDETYLRWEFLPQPQIGEASSDEHTICLGGIKTDDVFCIDLDFENCESFYVYSKEILEINLDFDKNLTWESGELYRNVVGGYIKLKLKKYYNTRPNHLFDNDNLKKRDFERRLCGKKGFATHDISHLYISYHYSGFGNSITECLELNEIKTDSEIEQMEKKEDELGRIWYSYKSGYARKKKDGTIILAFGENSKQTIKELCKQKEKKIYSHNTNEKF